MNTQTTSKPSNQSSQPLQTPSTDESLIPSTASPKKPRGKIAGLPGDKRDLINRMLDNGATYAKVVAELAKHGISLNLQNLSN